MKEQKLKNIAHISMGYSFRQKIEHQDDGNLWVITAKDIKDKFYLYSQDLLKINHTLKNQQLIKKGDVLLSSRGKFKAATLMVEQKMIAASSVYVFKVDKQIILSEFLVIWLNSNLGQVQINKNTTGATVKTITKGELENIKIRVPSLEKQQLLVDLYETKEKLNNKLKIKAEKVENIFQGTLAEIINSEN